MGELVGAGVQRRIRQLDSSAIVTHCPHGQGLGSGGRLPREALHQGLIGQGGGGLIPGPDLRDFRGRQEWQGMHGPVGLGHSPVQQGAEVPDEPADGGLLEQIGVVFHHRFHPARPAHRRQGEIELGDAHIQVQGLQLEAGQRHPLGGLLLIGEHGLEQRRVAGIPFRLHRIHHQLEGGVLVSVCGQSPITHLGQQLGKGGFSAEIGSQCQGVHKKADKRFDLGPIAVGDGRAHVDIVLARISMQQGLEPGQQGHEQGRVLTPGQLLQ